jgi:hypothetical protein
MPEEQYLATGIDCSEAEISIALFHCRWKTPKIIRMIKNMG